MTTIQIANGYIDFINGYNVNPANIYLELNMSKYILPDGKYWEVDYYYLVDKESVIDDIAFIINLLHGSTPFAMLSTFLNTALDTLGWDKEEFYEPLMTKIKEKYDVELKRNQEGTI